MAKLGFVFIALFLVLELTLAADAPSPAPASLNGADSSPQLAPIPERGSPYLAPSISPGIAASPPAPVAPSPSDLAPEQTPGSSPAPSPDEASDINHRNVNPEEGEENAGGGGGMSVGKKAGIVVAVVLAVCLVGIGGLVYKKRQDNIRRSQFGYAVRRELL